MATQARPYPVVGEIVVLSAALVALMRALSIPMTLLSALRSLVALPMALFKVLMRALAIFFSLFSLLEDLLPIVKAAAALLVLAAIVARLHTLVSRLRLEALIPRSRAHLVGAEVQAAREVPLPLDARGK